MCLYVYKIPYIPETPRPIIGNCIQAHRGFVLSVFFWGKAPFVTKYLLDNFSSNHQHTRAAKSLPAPSQTFRSALAPLHAACSQRVERWLAA